MNFNKRISDTTVRIGEVRFSYAHVFEPHSSNGGDPKYSVSVLVPKDNTQAVKLIEDAVNAAKQLGKQNKWGGKIPGNCKNPLRDGDTEREDDPIYEGCYFFNASASTKSKPAVKVVDGGEMFDAMDSEEFYSGCYGAAVINFYPYDANGNRGVAAGLNVVVKTRDGEKLGGGINVDAALSDLI